jgi:hypothetical protein
MEQIIQAISSKLNLPESTVREGVGIILNFLKQKGGPQFDQFAALLPGAEGLISAAPETSAGAAGLLSGIMGKASGLLGGDLGGAASALAALQQAGIPIDKAVPLAGEFVEQAKSVAGPEAVESLLNGIPALKSLLS